MSNHQPGPWYVYQDTAPGMEWNRHIHWGPNMTICFMAHSNRKNPARDEANANLVAAAPDLFEAAMEAKNFLIGDLEEPGRTVFWKLIAALKKAGWSA